MICKVIKLAIVAKSIQVQRAERLACCGIVARGMTDRGEVRERLSRRWLLLGSFNGSFYGLFICVTFYQFLKISVAFL